MSNYNFDKLDDNRGIGDLSEKNPLDFENRSGQDKKFGLSDNGYNVLMHLSQYLSYVLPILGIIAPLFLWLRNKNEDPIVDQHGRAIINWNLTMFIVFLICFFLIFFIIGLFLIWIPIILCLIFPVIGAIQANDGKVWKYPLSFKFL